MAEALRMAGIDEHLVADNYFLVMEKLKPAANQESEIQKLLKRRIGLEEFVIPDEESRTKQYREIAQMVGESPVVKRHDASGVELMLPSIMADEFADNHSVELEICMRWFSSDAGQVAKIEAPAGYAEVRAHALFHEQFPRNQQREAASAAQPAAPRVPKSVS
jgi:hypothetical protein